MQTEQKLAQSREPGFQIHSKAAEHAEKTHLLVIFSLLFH